MIRKLLPILGITFIDIVGFSMLIPILPYFVTHFGASAFIVGLLFATFSLCQFVSAPLWGNLSDRVGRKRVLIISQIGATIGWGTMAFVPGLALVLGIPAIAVIFVARIVEGVSGGNISITQAYVADLVQAKDRARAFGLIGATFGAGMVFGPFGGGLLFARFGFAAPFLAAAFLQFVTLVSTVTLLPESRARFDTQEKVGLNQVLASFKRPRLGRTLWQKLAISLALYGWFAVFALYLQRQLGFSLPQTDYLFSGFAAFNVFCNAVLVGRVSSNIGDRAMSNIGLALLVTGFALVPFVHAITLLAGVMIIFSCGMAFTNTGITALISNAASDREQGTVLGTSSSLDSLSGIIAPPVSTGLLAAYGPRLAGAESIAMALVALLMGLAQARGEQGTSALKEAPQ
ncbi:MAG: MFS transporter [Candidatus Eremiobacteraeota bacterium]|nr:MFS transporter [Candidatus Eremiobacteraeota bacterium]MBV8374585.1 MFS transporter [Candidatus Eremiobacteraeota bacterium]